MRFAVIWQRMMVVQRTNEPGSTTARPVVKRKRRKPREMDKLIGAIISRSSEPIGAYELARLAGEEGEKVSPTQVYRCLERLLLANEIEHIASLNAYIISKGQHRIHLLCNKCGKLESVDENETGSALTRIADELDFRTLVVHVEVSGLCSACS